MKTVEIMVSRLDALREKLDKLNRKAAKRGLPPIEVAVTGEVVDRLMPYVIDGEYINLPRAFMKVTIQGALPKIGGYDVIGFIRDVAGARQIYGDSVPADLRHCDLKRCDHCKVERYRTQVAVIGNEQGEVKVIGKTCFKDFFGDEDAGTLEAFGSHYIAVINTVDEFEEGDMKMSLSSSAFELKADRFLALAVAVSDAVGYVNREKSESESQPTTGESAFNDYLKGIEPSAAHVERAQEIANYFLSRDHASLTNFEFNIVQILKSNAVTRKSCNILAASLPMYWLAQEQARGASRSEYVGEIKKREVFDLTFKSCFVSPGAYGCVYRHIFEDQAGNSLVWAASDSLMVEVTGLDGEVSKRAVERGDRVLLKATVKEHSVYRNRAGNETKTTYITRGSLVGVVGDSVELEQKKAA